MLKKHLILSFFILFAFFSGCSKTEKSSITFCSWGGSYQEAQRNSYLIPFEKEFGIEIKEASFSGEFAKIKAMVETNNIQWDIVSVTQSIFSRGIKEGLFEPLDFSVVDTSNMLPGTVNKYGVAHLLFSTILSYNTEVYKNGKFPQNWNQFWDVKNFPGNRSLRDSPIGNLEYALLSTGISADSLYPLNIDLAFKRMTELKPSIKVWWSEGQQPPQLLSTGNIDLVTAYNGRIWKARQDGQPVNLIWNQGMLEPEYFVVLKGSRNKGNTMKLINFAIQAPQQEKFVKIMGYGPTNRLTLNNLPDSLKADLPSSLDNFQKQFMLNGEWWANNEEQVLEMWNKWKLN